MSIHLTHLKQEIETESAINHSSDHLQRYDFKSHSNAHSKQKDDSKFSEESMLKDKNQSFIYKTLLHLIKYFFLFARTFKIFVSQINYFFYINYLKTELYIKNNNNNNNINDYQYLSHKLNENNGIFKPPNHVCVIINEKIIESEVLHNTLSIIAKVLSAAGVKTLSFYQFNG